MTPEAMDFLIALSSLLFLLRLMLILTTAGLSARAVIQSAAAMIDDDEPLPLQFRARTDTGLTPLATP
ncbi:hypothetical protein GCM10010416_73190 [Streptomyces caniferus]